MKLRLLVVFLLLGGMSWAGAAALTGAQARKAYDQLVEHLDGLGGLAVSTDSYTPGSLTSTAITRIRLPALPGDQVSRTERDRVENGATTNTRPVAFRLRHVIEHSPLARSDGSSTAVRIVTTLDARQATESTRRLLAAFEGRQPFVLASELGSDGHATHRLDVASATWRSAAGTGHFDGASHRIHIGATGEFEGSGQFAGGDLPLSDNARLEFARTDQAYSGALNSNGTLAMQHSLRADSLTLNLRPDGRQNGEPSGQLSGQLSGQPLGKPFGKPIHADDLTLELDVALQDQQLDGTLRLTSDAVDAPIPVQRIDLQATASQLAATDISRWLRLAGSTGLPSPAGTTTTAPAAADTPDWSTLLRQILLPGTSAIIDLALGNRNGDLHAVTEVLFHGDGSADGFASMNVLGDLLGALQATMVLDADADTFNGTPLAALLSSPLLSQAVGFDGTTYRSELTLQDQTLRINGNRVPLQFLLADFLARPL